MTTCELVQFAVDRYGEQINIDSVGDMLANGIVVEKAHQGQELIVTLIHRNTDGHEDGTSHYLSTNGWTSTIQEMRISETPTSVRSRSLSRDTCA